MTNMRRWSIGISTFLFVLILSFFHLGGIEYIETAFLDTCFKIRGAVKPSTPVVIVAVDDNSVFTYGRWPWSRERMATLVDKLSKAKAGVIAFDIVFPPIKDNTGRQSHGDKLFARAARESGNVIFPIYFRLKPDKEEAEVPIPQSVNSSSFLLFDDIQYMKELNLPKGYTLFPTDEILAAGASGVGHVNTILDKDNSIRFEPLIIEYREQYFPTLSIQVVRRFLDLSWGEIKVERKNGIRIGNTRIPMDNNGALLINYYGPLGSFPYLSYKEVMENPTAVDQCEDKIVLIGVTVAALHDQWKTPFDKQLPGVEKHANIISNILDGRFLSRPWYMGWVEAFSPAILGIVLTFLFPRLTQRKYLLLTIITLAGIGVLSYLAFAYLNLWFKPFFSFLFIILLLPGLFLAGKSAEPINSRHESEVTGATGITSPERGGSLTLSGDEPGKITDRIGRYIIQEEIGRGAMGVVYKALDPNINRTLVIKTIQFDKLYESGQVRQLKERFFSEAEAAGRLSHPNIVTIYDAGEEAGYSYIAMEYVEGRDLSHFTQGGNLMRIRKVAEVMASVCDALDYAHRENIVHRDIKPANIMIIKDGRVKVMDFGIAKLPSSHLTQTGTVIGTPSYMSPEQVRGAALDGRSDIFSVGVVLYELATGDKPFKGDNISAVMFQITEREFIPPQKLNGAIPNGFVNILDKALKKKPEDRYQTSAELARDLTRFSMEI